MKLLGRIKRLHKRINCDHEWKLVEPEGEYYDATGFHIIRWKCKCSKCSKEQIRKFY